MLEIPPTSSDEMAESGFTVDTRPFVDPYALGVSCEKGTMYPETCALCKKSKILINHKYPELCGFCSFKKDKNIMSSLTVREKGRSSFGEDHLRNPMTDYPHL